MAVSPRAVRNLKNSLVSIDKDARAEAARAMPTCLDLVNRGGPGSANAELGEAMPIIRIGLNKLKSSGSSASLFALLPRRTRAGQVSTAASEVLYPILLGSEIAGSVTLESQTDGTWKPTVFNKLGLARSLAEATQARRGAGRAPDEQYAGVSVRALGLYFRAVLGDSGVLFVPLASDKEAGFEKGVAMPDSQALALLSRLANAYNGQPG